MNQSPTQAMNTQTNKSESIANLVVALIKAQAVISNPRKDAYNPHHNSKFASLGNYIEATKKPLLDHGLILIQGLTGSGKLVGVDTTLAHTSGEWISFSCSVECVELRKDKATGQINQFPGDGQTVGSLTTYLRRYSIASILNLTGDDDDGEADRVARSDASHDHQVASVPTYSAPKPTPAPASSRASAPASGSPGSGVVEFGKHKGKSIAQVFADDPEYISWLAHKRELKNAPDGKPYRKDVAFTEECRAFLSSQSSQSQTSDEVPF